MYELEKSLVNKLRDEGEANEMKRNKDSKPQ